MGEPAEKTARLRVASPEDTKEYCGSGPLHRCGGPPPFFSGAARISEYSQMEIIYIEMRKSGVRSLYIYQWTLDL